MLNRCLCGKVLGGPLTICGRCRRTQEQIKKKAENAQKKAENARKKGERLKAEFLARQERRRHRPWNGIFRRSPWNAPQDRAGGASRR